MRYLVEVAGRRWQVVVEAGRVVVDGVEHQAELRAFAGSARRLLVLDGKSIPLTVEPMHRGKWMIAIQGERQEVEVVDERTASARRTAGHGAIQAGPVALKAPMPGRVARILVVPGQEVVAGDGLIVLEAMKMENELKAAGPGVVERVAVRGGQTVEKGELLVTFR
ncbi:MAG TPA: acetyl-CoA carboxylase biotin carboxyl carrier protein subunit [Gemmatimonadales bacterium]|nr:acetyl-CoA carboxylase biotin carboxyl carrier protein subunit [Gemmatimonadales bacterium]